MRVILKLIISFSTTQDPENPSNELIVDMDIKVRIVCFKNVLQMQEILTALL